MDEWVRKMWHVHNGILFHKKEGDTAICNNMDKPGGHYAKADRERQILYGITYLWNLKKN